MCVSLCSSHLRGRRLGNTVVSPIDSWPYVVMALWEGSTLKSYTEMRQAVMWLPAYPSTGFIFLTL